jgi:hypothetical protein
VKSYRIVLFCYQFDTKSLLFSRRKLYEKLELVKMLPDEIKEKNIDKLCADLKNEDVNVRVKAIRALKEIKSLAAVKHLIKALETERNDSNIANIYGILRATGGEEATAFFLDCLKLKKEKELDRKFWRHHGRAISALVEIGDPIIDEKIYDLIADDDSEGKSAFAEEFVRRKTKEGKHALIAILNHSYNVVRNKAAIALEKIVANKVEETIILEIKKEESDFNSFLHNKLQELLINIGASEWDLEQNDTFKYLESFRYRNKFWIKNLKEILEEKLSNKWIKVNLEYSEIENALVKALNEEQNRGVKGTITEILWNIGSENSKSTFVEKQIENQISELVKQKDVEKILDLFQNYWDIEGERVSYDEFLQIFFKGLERVNTEEAIEQFLFLKN